MIIENSLPEAQELIKKTKIFVRETLANAEGGHDWWHIYRVWKNAKAIAAHEQVDTLVVELAALLHDIADSKFHEGDEEIGPRMAGEFLAKNGVESAIILHVQHIIRNMSFKAGFDPAQLADRSIELQVVQDADRLDAMGAIGIARAFSYGGFKNRELYNPEIRPNLRMSKDEYKNSTAPTINHFYEKLLLLKNLFNTDKGKKMAEGRHLFMLTYLEEFYAEFEGLAE